MVSETVLKDNMYIRDLQIQTVCLVLAAQGTSQKQLSFYQSPYAKEQWNTSKIMLREITYC
jgi:hypothetical protein